MNLWRPPIWRISSWPGPKIKMIGIRKQDLDAELFEILLRLSLDRRGCAHGHERRRFDHAVRSGQTAEARARRIGGENFEMKAHPGECIRRPLPSGPP